MPASARNHIRLEKSLMLTGSEPQALPTTTAVTAGKAAASQ